MKIGLIIAGGVVALVVLLFVVRLIALHFVDKRGASVIAEHYKPEDIVRQDAQADGRGLLSAGIATRGNGALVLTKTDLAFFPITGSEVDLPVAKISHVDIVNNHNGYSGRPLLQVHFTSDGGKDDAYAWYVRDQEQWKNDIDRVRGGK